MKNRKANKRIKKRQQILTALNVAGQKSYLKNR